jgi:hypothetical protein
LTRVKGWDGNGTIVELDDGTIQMTLLETKCILLFKNI